MQLPRIGWHVATITIPLRLDHILNVLCRSGLCHRCYRGDPGERLDGLPRGAPALSQDLRRDTPNTQSQRMYVVSSEYLRQLLTVPTFAKKIKLDLDILSFLRLVNN